LARRLEAQRVVSSLAPPPPLPFSVPLPFTSLLPYSYLSFFYSPSHLLFSLSLRSLSTFSPAPDTHLLRYRHEATDAEGEDHSLSLGVARQLVSSRRTELNRAEHGFLLRHLDIAGMVGTGPWCEIIGYGKCKSTGVGKVRQLQKSRCTLLQNCRNF